MKDYIDPFAEDYDPSTAPKEQTITMCDDCRTVLYSSVMDTILEKLDGRKLICLIIHGSKLYGTDHKNSDTDIKGVFIPNQKDYLMCNVKDVIKFSTGNDGSKNSKDDFDVELWSINKFFQEAKQGDTGAISMLNAPFDKICSQRPVWQTIKDNAGMFYCKDMAGLIGFVRTQANKYSIKGERLSAAKEAQFFLDNTEQDIRVLDVWNNLPLGKYSIEVVDTENNQRFWEVCGRKIQDTSSIGYALNVVNSIIKSYGVRANAASVAGGLDWKAISHAFRVASELSDLFEFGMIRYPLVDSAQIKRMKMGELDFNTEVLPDLNSLMDRVHEMSQKSNLPDKINVERVDDFLYELLKQQ